MTTSKTRKINSKELEKIQKMKKYKMILDVNGKKDVSISTDKSKPKTEKVVRHA